MTKKILLLLPLIITSCSQITSREGREIIPATKEVETQPEKNTDELADKSNTKVEIKKTSEVNAIDLCKKELNKLPGKTAAPELVERSCEHVKVIPSCYSQTKNEPIYHYEKFSTVSEKPRRILTFALVHGDELASGSVAREWMARLENIDPRSHWRIIPILNPDGYKKNWRTNGRGVDINRNFPSKDWAALAHKYWGTRARKSLRRFPGKEAGSEAETKCAMEHIKEFKPDLVIAIHTPLGLLDFDGPKINFPKFEKLPWRRLGHFPGSLGRYMWQDHKVPVLTIELKGSNQIHSFKTLDQLQDISGIVALMVDDY